MRIIKKILAIFIILSIVGGLINIKPVNAVKTYQIYDKAVIEDASEYLVNKYNLESINKKLIKVERSNKDERIDRWHIRHWTYYYVTYIQLVPKYVSVIQETFDSDHNDEWSPDKDALYDETNDKILDTNLYDLTKYHKSILADDKDKDKDNDDNKDNNDYNNGDSDKEETPVITPITIYAKSLEKHLTKGGNLYFKVTFDSSIRVKEAPILKVKFGDKTRQLVYEEQNDKSIIYSTALNSTKDCGSTITFESLSEGKIESKKANTITTMDYESQLEIKDLGKVGNFILVDNGARGVINKDGRIDELDVEEILNCTDKKIADVNGDGKIDTLDRDDLRLAIEKMDTKYINYLKVNNLKIYGDTNNDGVINYHDIENVVANLGKKLSNNNMEIYDVDGNGDIDLIDVIYMTKAIKSQEPMYLMHIKLNTDSCADLCQTDKQKGVLNAKDVLAIASLTEEEKAKGIGDINRDGVVNIYDQIALTQMFYANDISKTKYFKVFIGANGDVNSDGFIDYLDQQKIAQYIIDGDETQLDVSKADVNKDGEINVYDSIKIASALNEADNTFNSKVELLKNSYYIIPKDGEYGDINQDGIINYDDAKAIAESIISEDKKLDVSVADINGDGKVDTNDAIKIMQKLNGLDSDFCGIKDMDKQEINVTEGKLGDVNQDGRINFYDVQLLAKSIVSEETKLDIEVADVNRDGKVDLYDVIDVVQNLLNVDNFETRIMYGDVDQNNEINMFDLILLNKYLINSSKYPLTEAGLKAADVLNDGKVNVSDSTILLNYMCELITVDELGKK